MAAELDDRWFTRDLPVLVACAKRLEDEPLMGAGLHELAADTGFSDAEVETAVHALDDGGLIDVRWVSPAHAGRVYRMSAQARREVGLWPTPETALDRMIAALEAIADNTDDEDTRTRVRKILDGLTGAGRQVGISVAAAALTGQLPG